MEVLRIEAAATRTRRTRRSTRSASRSPCARARRIPWKAAPRSSRRATGSRARSSACSRSAPSCELRPGVDGLIHISALSERRIAHPRDVVKVGEEVEVAVEKIDPAEKRIGLRRSARRTAQPVGRGVRAGRSGQPLPSEPRRARRPAPEGGPGRRRARSTASSPTASSWRSRAARACVPASETGTERGTDLKRHFQLGQELKVQILEIDASGKIRLSAHRRRARRGARGDGGLAAHPARRVAAQRASAPSPTCSRAVSCRP